MPRISYPKALRIRICWVEDDLLEVREPCTALHGGKNSIVLADLGCPSNVTNKLGTDNTAVVEFFPLFELTSGMKNHHTSTGACTTGTSVESAGRYHNCIYSCLVLAYF